MPTHSSEDVVEEEVVGGVEGAGGVMDGCCWWKGAVSEGGLLFMKASSKGFVKEKFMKLKVFPCCLSLFVLVDEVSRLAITAFLASKEMVKRFMIDTGFIFILKNLLMIFHKATEQLPKEI